MTAEEDERLLPDLPDELASEPLVLTAHPLQRCGAFAVAALAEVEHPRQVDQHRLAAVWRQLADALVKMADKADAKKPGAFWLSLSYMLWPNSKMNTSNRKRQSVEERRRATLGWRTVPPVEAWPGVPCVLCSRAACGFFGKVDVPLAPSSEYRNTTVPGHDGLALCVGCLASFYALPHGCLVHGGRLSVVHSWDEDFLSTDIHRQVRDTAMVAQGEAPTLPSGGFEREQLVVDGIRRFRRPLSSDVSLVVFTNSNKEQEVTEYHLGQSLAHWIRAVALHSDLDAALGELQRACSTPKASGAARIARLLVTEPDQLPRLVAGTLRDQAEQKRPACVPWTAPGQHALLSSYLKEVMGMSENHVQEIEQLGARAAQLIIEQEQPLKKFTVAYRRVGEFRRWINAQTVAWLSSKSGKGREPFITPRQLKLLFEYGDQAWLYRNLLFTAVLAELHQRNYVPDSEDANQARETVENTPVEEEYEQ